MLQDLSIHLHGLQMQYNALTCTLYPYWHTVGPVASRSLMLKYWDSCWENTPCLQVQFSATPLPGYANIFQQYLQRSYVYTHVWWDVREALTMCWYDRQNSVNEPISASTRFLALTVQTFGATFAENNWQFPQWDCLVNHRVHSLPCSELIKFPLNIALHLKAMLKFCGTI